MSKASELADGWDAAFKQVLGDPLPEYESGFDILKYAPALPANYHPQEISSYSPALKKTGGYSYAPPATSGESQTAKPREPRRYQPNFLMPFTIPEASAEQQEEQEPKKQDGRKQPQGNNTITLGSNNIYGLPAGFYFVLGNNLYDGKGNLVYSNFNRK